MIDVIFVTGNKHKAEHYAKLLGIDIESMAADVHEIQAKDTAEVVTQKAKDAYAQIGRPVIVDDFSLWFDDLDGLPGPFIKYFVEAKNGLENLCRMADGLPSRRITQRAYTAHYDGTEMTLFYGELRGEAVQHPRANSDFSYGADPIFAPDGYGGRTRSELTREEYEEVYQQIRPIAQMREFLQSRYG